MKQNEIQSLQRLRTENLENILNVHQTDDNKYYYNLLQTVEIPDNLPNGYYYTYTVQQEDVWPNISYKAYNTPNLWWAIVSANKILDPTKIPEPGTIIKILKPDVVSLILDQTSSQAN